MHTNLPHWPVLDVTRDWYILTSQDKVSQASQDKVSQASQDKVSQAGWFNVNQVLRWLYLQLVLDVMRGWYILTSQDKVSQASQDKVSQVGWFMWTKFKVTVPATGPRCDEGLVYPYESG